MTQTQLSENDKTMIGLLRSTPEMTVCQLTEEMGVTATAVRQRLTKLMALELVDRSHIVEGRGRPSHHYVLTEKGSKSLANNLLPGLGELFAGLHPAITAAKHCLGHDITDWFWTSRVEPGLFTALTIRQITKDFAGIGVFR